MVFQPNSINLVFIQFFHPLRGTILPLKINSEKECSITFDSLIVFKFKYLVYNILLENKCKNSYLKSNP